MEQPKAGSEPLTHQLGKFLLLSEIAKGGMAEIWIASHQVSPGHQRLVVIKMLRPSLKKNREFVHMFLNEARIAARLNHPNVVQMYDLGYAEGNYFLAMEYIHGENLRNTTKSCRKTGVRIPLPLSLAIIDQTCRGLHYAHTKTDVMGHPLNIVHCDISPQNIVISFSGEVKVVDFGVARAASRFEQVQQGVVKGKLAYMSPEQIGGGELDARSDIFSAGIVLWELCTWKRLFGSFSPKEIVKLIPGGQVPPPRRINPEISPTLEAVILKALAKRPDDRFQSAREMHDALQAAIHEHGPAFEQSHISSFMNQTFAHKLESVDKIEQAREAGELGSMLFHDLQIGDEEISAVLEDFSAESDVVNVPRPAQQEIRQEEQPVAPVQPRFTSARRPAPAVVEPPSVRRVFILLLAAALICAAAFLLFSWWGDRQDSPPAPAKTSNVGAPWPTSGSVHVVSEPPAAASSPRPRPEDRRADQER